MPVTLEQLLQSRDNRAQHQKDLLGTFPGKSLLCFTVQLPGADKRNARSLAIARAGVEAVWEAFAPCHEELRDLETGFEGYFVVDVPAREAKLRACRIEDTHPLGRLMDIDVVATIDPEAVFSAETGRNLSEENYFSGGFPKNQFSSSSFTASPVTIVGREAVGLPPRRCLLCGAEVRHCMRARTHTTEQLLQRIGELVEAYLVAD